MNKYRSLNGQWEDISRARICKCKHSWKKSVKHRSSQIMNDHAFSRPHELEFISLGHGYL